MISRKSIGAEIFFILMTTGTSWAFLGGKTATHDQKPSGGSGDASILGSDVIFESYPTGNGKDFSCSFDNKCCWSNSPSSGQVPWRIASGHTEAAKLESLFGTPNAPSGHFLAATSEGSKDKTTVFYSCPIQCAYLINLSLRHWQGKGVSVKICEEADPNGQMHDCEELPHSSGITDTVTLPGGKNLRIAIIAEGLAQPNSAAILDDLKVEIEPCHNITTSTSIVATTPPASSDLAEPKAKAACSNVACDFEKNNFCHFSPSNDTSKRWEVTEAPFGNPHTGIKRGGQGRYFAAVYLKSEEVAVLSSDDFAPSGDPVSLHFQWYRSTQGLDLAICCDDAQNCNAGTTKKLSADDYRTWKSAKAECPAGTHKVFFYAKNNGNNQGALGLDGILIQTSSGSAQNC